MPGINELFNQPKLIIGVVHLLPLIRSPRPATEFEEIRTRALSNAGNPIDNGIDGIIVENYDDAPFSQI